MTQLDPASFKFWAGQVSELADKLDKRIYHYNTPVQDTPAFRYPPSGLLLPPSLPCGQPATTDVRKLLPAPEVLQTFAFYRPLSLRCHGKSTEKGRMIYRADGWMFPGSVLHYNDDALMFFMSEKRATIDQISERLPVLPAPRLPSLRNSPFLMRNKRSTMQSYSDEDIILQLPCHRGIDLLPTETSRKRKAPARSSNRKKRRTR